MLDGGVMDGGSMEMVLVGGEHSWQEIDRDLRMIAKRQRALDADEVALLWIAERVRIWEELGKASLLEYLEDIFGYGPKVAYERIRVARALEQMPELYEALERGEVSYSALREITRVATAETQRDWLDSIRDKSQRQIEELARSRKKGAKPTDPADPDLKPRTRNFEVTPATDALLRQARQVLAGERGHFIDDDEFLAAMATAVLEGGAGSSAQTGAKYQIRVTVCPNCDQAVQEGAGRKIAISAADAARAQCDAQRIGDDHRAKQDIAPATRRMVWHRDGGKCAVPSCRSSRYIDIHHIVGRAEGGNHEAGNLTLLCDGHHRALHNGKLVITGLAPDLSCRFVHDPIPHVETPSPRATTAPILHVEKPSKFAITAMIVQAKQVLRTSGFAASEVNRFVEAAPFAFASVSARLSSERPQSQAGQSVRVLEGREQNVRGLDSILGVKAREENFSERTFDDFPTWRIQRM